MEEKRYDYFRLLMVSGKASRYGQRCSGKLSGGMINLQREQKE